VLDDPASGTVVKLPGRVDLDQGTGQLTISFDQNPQLPFETLKIHMFDGPQAALSTPVACGSYATVATLDSWAQPEADVALQSPFQVTSGPAGSPCPADAAHLPFAPSFTGGSAGTVAGSFSPFVFSLARADGEQDLSSLRFTAAPGQLADIAAVARCGDADAAAGSCPAGSQIGTVMVASGTGPEPVFLSGKVFLTGPYKGAPFGEEVVVPAVAGPFNLGDVVVRGTVSIDPATSQVTVVSDPFPTMLQGIPVDIRRVEAHLDRPNLEFTPTSCDPTAVTGSLTSTQGTTVPFSSRFQVGNCGALRFQPSFSASTQGNGTFNHNGASFDVKVASGEGPGSGEANIRKVEVQLPKRLPARLTTLQKACTEAQFAVNPAGCPAASDVGIAVARTPILSSPLSGPAYLVSHGGQAFPDLVLILQGEGITLRVTGHTQIKNGITYSRFETVPDAPVSSFELNLPESPTSALAATESLCSNTRTVTVRKRVLVRRNGHTRRVTRSVRQLVSEPLAMPTKITAQNGAVLNQTTQIGVTGCAKAKPKRASKKKARGHNRGGRGGKGARG
jgi:hypothetical protein